MWGEGGSGGIGSKELYSWCIVRGSLTVWQINEGVARIFIIKTTNDKKKNALLFDDEIDLRSKQI